LDDVPRATCHVFNCTLVPQKRGGKEGGREGGRERRREREGGSGMEEGREGREEGREGRGKGSGKDGIREADVPQLGGNLSGNGIGLDRHGERVLFVAQK